MSNMNIAGTQSVDDPEYRYKMPRLITKIEGRGNGIKTLVVNCHDVATSLHRSTPEVCKFFGTELGAQSKYDDKTDRAIVNGAFDSMNMQNHLSKYIEGFVLCPACRLPETKYKFKGQTIFHKCYACGAVEPVDMKHKLTTFILKEHTAAKRASSKEDKKRKTKKDRKVTENECEEGFPKDKKKKDKKKKKAKEEKVEWHTDLSPEAVAARAAEAEAIEAGALSAMETSKGKDIITGMNGMYVDDENVLECAINSLHKFINESARSSDQIMEELICLQSNSALAISDRLVIFIRAVFHGANPMSQVKMDMSVLGKLIDSQPMQYRLIALCEYLCAIEDPSRIAQFPIILKKFYDEDLMDEECLIAWMNDGIRKQYAHWQVTEAKAKSLREHLKVFTDWLENAEEESEED